MKMYSLSDIADDGSLKVSPLLFVIILYLSRHLLLVVFTIFNVIVAIRKRSHDSPFEYLVEFSSGPLFLLASAGSLLVLIAMQKRHPEAGSNIRWTWKRGKWLLVGSGSLDILLLIHKYAHNLGSASMLVYLTVMMDILIIFYLIKSVRVQDTFNDFCKGVVTDGNEQSKK
jgi:hypothetical protein